MSRHVSASLRRSRGVVVGAMLAVAAIVLGFTQITLLGTGTGGSADGGANGSPNNGTLARGEDRQVARTADQPVVDLDVAPTQAPAAVRGCLVRGFATDPARVSVVYGLEQRTASSTSPTLVLRNAAGELRLCDELGGDYPSTAPIPRATASKPVAFLSNGRTRWDCTQHRTLTSLMQTSWLSVASAVDRVQLSYVVDGVPGPWFSTSAQGGFVHLQSWLKGPLPRDTKLQVETRVLDASGSVVRQRTLPTGPQRLATCPGPGSAEIG